MIAFEGCGTALVTPFTESGAVDFLALGALVEWQIAEGIDFLVPCGSTGEAQTLDDGERERVVAAVVETAAESDPKLGSVIAIAAQTFPSLASCSSVATPEIAALPSPW